MGAVDRKRGSRRSPCRAVVVGQIWGSRNRCRNCGRATIAEPGHGIQAFCCVTCFERYPVDACASLAMRDLAFLVSSHRPKSVTDAIRTCEDLEAAAVAVLRESRQERLNLNPDGFIPSWIVTRRGADRARSFNAHRVEPEGPPAVRALAVERAYILARGGGSDMEARGGYLSLPPDTAAGMASLIIRELPREALEALAGMLGSGADTRRLLADLGGADAAEAHDRAFAQRPKAKVLPPTLSSEERAVLRGRCSDVVEGDELRRLLEARSR